MEIVFVNFPEGVSLEGGLALNYLTIATRIAGEPPKTTFEKTKDQKTKVHVKIIDIPIKMLPSAREQLAWHILWTLHYHHLDEGADVYFVVPDKGKKYFTMSDFPELYDKPHPSIK